MAKKKKKFQPLKGDKLALAMLTEVVRGLVYEQATRERSDFNWAEREGKTCNEIQEIIQLGKARKG